MVALDLCLTSLVYRYDWLDLKPWLNTVDVLTNNS